MQLSIDNEMIEYMRSREIPIGFDVKTQTQTLESMTSRKAMLKAGIAYDSHGILYMKPQAKADYEAWASLKASKELGAFLIRAVSKRIAGIIADHAAELGELLEEYADDLDKYLDQITLRAVIAAVMECKRVEEPAAEEPAGESRD